MNNALSQVETIQWLNAEAPKKSTSHTTDQNRRNEAINLGLGSHASFVGFTGVKGGVGTTTLAMNIAIVLQQRGHKVVYVEMSPHFGSAAWLVGINPIQTLNLCTTNPSEIHAALIQEAVMTHPMGLKIFCVSPSTNNHGHQIQSATLTALFTQLEILADIIILDFPLEQSPQATWCLAHSHLVNTVMDISPMNIASAQWQLPVIHTHARGPIFLTGTNLSNIPISKHVDHLQEEWAPEAFMIIPSASELFYTAQVEHKPVVHLQPCSSPALHIKKLCEQILDRIDTHQTDDSARQHNTHRKEDRTSTRMQKG